MEPAEGNIRTGATIGVVNNKKVSKHRKQEAHAA
jgi:hypothetical protein